MRKTLIILAVVLSIAFEAMAVEPFDKVPKEHWAYQAVNQLQKHGILIGYPEGAFNGKRLMTRYEFAVATARMSIISYSADNSHAVDAPYKSPSNMPIVKPTREDIDAIHKLANEFFKELIALGIDTAALGVKNSSPPPSVNRFSDVPMDHWAYDAVNQLRKDGVLIGSARDTFDGSRPITRNEFAAAIARLIPVIKAMSLSETRSKIEDLNQRISAIDGQGAPQTSDLATKQELSNLATKEDVDALNKLINEFSNELRQMRVDVDALKRDVASLNKRVNKADKDKLF